ncbi:T9SS type A sorting domain-containing protein [Chryseobacterium sp. PBS4-4]|uniref:T9SS type A sorting domain-containing protein n=1 Tax=Chryseobacterium edaphi TaxID=2976532 RepID=A0ABT2W2C8_9FLAO|nr:T9SS type A sorting domain-containing protein [Chryseobacterium edaphi]MCU7616376.1 T9SS type A sorting domain-containing protein [Chryseobacterium edaphi]
MKKNYSFTFKRTLLLFGLAVNFLSLKGQQWENVGSSANVSAGGSSYNNLTVDATGKYYLSYYDTSVSKGSVQKFEGNSWSYLGGTAGITTGIALYNSLSVDGLGNVFYTNQGTGLEVRKFSGTSWSALTSATSNTVNFHASAVSPANVLFTYSSDGSGTVRRFANNVWEQVGNAGFSSGAAFAEMVIGTNNKIYTCNVSSGVRVYENTTSATSTDNWTMVGGAIVDASSSGEQYTSDIAIDGNNNVYVAYISNSTSGRKINVKKWNGTSWSQVGNANFSAKAVQHLAIAVTSGGTPFVVASQWDSSDGNHLKNTVYKLDSVTDTWSSFGGSFVSDDQATYNDLAIDALNNYLVLAYSQGTTKVKRISLSNLSVNDAKKEVSTVYPNPTTGIIYVKGEDKIKSVQVSDVAGRTVTSQNDAEKIDISNATAGVYFVTIKTQTDKIITKKIIKK